MAKRRQLTDDPEYNGHPILTDKKKGLKCDKKILKKIDETFNHVLNDHKQDRVFFMRYDVRYPNGAGVIGAGESNAMFRSFQAKFMKNLSRQGLNPHYVAVKEQSKEKHSHYHAMLLLDERKTQSIKKHIEKADELWGNTLGIPGRKRLIDDCTKDRDGNPQKNGIKIKKNSDDFKNQCDKAFEWASYLAKANTKTSTSDRELFASRLNHPAKRKREKEKQ